MAKWSGLDKPITAEAAEQERDRLSFERRPPSPATRAALAQAQQHAPPLQAADLALVKARQRPRQAG